MKSPIKSFLTAAFLAAALIVPAQQAQAFTSVHVSPAVHIMIMNNAAQNARNAARHHRQEQAVNAVIANPSVAAIKEAVDNNALESNLVPYIGAAREEMKLSTNLKAEDVTDGQNSQFISLLKDMRLAAEVTAPSPRAAENLGLDRSLAIYLAAAQKEAHIVPGQSASPEQVKISYNYMSQQRWENSTKPVVVTFGIAAAALGGAGLAAAVLSSRRRPGYDF